LDNLTPKARHEVLSHLKNINRIPLAEIVAIENQVRLNVRKLPNHFLSSAPEELKFWGSVFSESHQQEAIFEELEKTNPEIVPKLRKYRFSLDEAAALPDGLLNRVLAEADNEELGLALSTCEANVAETILDALSERRRKVIEAQLPGYRKVPREQANHARSRLTQKFREVLAA
jgi:flagellar motor switch protein FliG